jgi:GNAT superfamily N-acetyltransferase
MSIISRAYRLENDFQEVMEFLRDTYIETRSLHNWLPPRFENSRSEMAPNTFIWEEIEDSNPRIVAVANPEIRFQYFIQIHPDYSILENEIIEWIINHCTSQKLNSDDALKISIVALDGNPNREAALHDCGFERDRIYGILRIRDVRAPIPDYSLPDGYTIRAVIPQTDFPKIAENIRIVFSHGDWFTAEILEGLSQSSFYNPELDLVVVAPDRSIASFCTFRMDPPSRITELEPMGTHPDHRRLGLAKALLSEGFKRLKRYDPSLLYIGGAPDTPEANRLYEATGFTERYEYYYWCKMI